MEGTPEGCTPSEIVEVRFKNTRKGFYLNNSNLKLNIGDIVAVEAALGHDIGIVSLTGELVREQMRLKKVDLERNPLKKIYRKAKPHDIEKWQQAIALEHDTMIRSRVIAAELGLDMKIGDVEYQGDKTKAIFYYIANDRVDFRKLIKILAETFHIRIEMKQIGARQEAGRIGGIGSCGRKLCCSTFITNFISVSTSAARYQDISLNPQKLAGQCGKLKCCLNYEVDAYIDEQKDFPSTNIWLNTGEGMLYHQKTDIFGRNMSYSFDKEGRGTLIKLSVARVKEIIAMNKRGQIPAKAVDVEKEEQVNIGYTDGVGEESLNRFDEKNKIKANEITPETVITGKTTRKRTTTRITRINPRKIRATTRGTSLKTGTRIETKTGKATGPSTAQKTGIITNRVIVPTRNRQIARTDRKCYVNKTKTINRKTRKIINLLNNDNYRPFAGITPAVKITSLSTYSFSWPLT